MILKYFITSSCLHRFVRTVKRETFECADNENPMKKAKALGGLTGVRGVKTDIGGTISFKPYNSNTIMFITFGE